MKIGIPKEYRVDGMAAESEVLWQRGADWLKAGGAEMVEISLPHTKRAAGLLHCRTCRGFIQLGPL
jgi:aspartyl-tRNA(Asn)/glutamyl-tRNA(Gln) amidotransferase subunit A